MKAIRIAGYDATPIVEDIAIPVPVVGQVLVRVLAVGLNPLDVKLQRGYVQQFFPLSFPYTLGTDFAGEIAVVGEGVETWRPGDKVIGRTDPTMGGAVAEYVAVRADYLAKAPATVDLYVAAGVPTAAGTAWQALMEGAALSGKETVLIHAGAGGVGSFAIQFVRHAGARVVSTASGDGIEIAQRLGAAQVIDYRRDDFATAVSGADIVLDTIGGETERRSYHALRTGGRLFATALPPDEALATAHGVAAAFVFHASDGQRLRRVADAIDRDGVKVLVDRKVPLDDFGAAFGRQASGRARGKIILTLE
ncbi:MULTISPECIES: NADP-dependent oxidoreductase [unclassified Ensifer]|uniref:NADP-dependent oxidoreductase n=1 Tax=unclassified Ensifer TaxID=2633371 RepID=UPI00081385C1|nr:MULTISPECIES: NADP-dependent oxidoreductase [unclassified Ensifer]OCP05735.1 NADPH:quinone oxidoreductase [Ensifer sp. LC11]OCP06480.1 NADPH:quinone oxidoreductase [Ensifer sp. LC13]OCP06794.1 NADPH:quinone oxidoreductase [Ensifer sp. LC14]OCP31281.1 NADPH:quinone oxidoreductase [Ensifer sp. LC499]